MAEIDSLVEQLGKLTVIEAGELAKKLEKAWNLDLNKILQTPVQEFIEEKVQTTFNVVLTGFEDGKKIPVIQKIRKYKEMGLLEAKNFVESSIEKPNEIKTDIEKEEAETIKKEVEEVGGKVEIKWKSFGIGKLI